MEIKGPTSLICAKFFFVPSYVKYCPVHFYKCFLIKSEMMRGGEIILIMNRKNSLSYFTVGGFATQ